MKFIYKIESILISIIFLLCFILVLKSLFKLRSALLWRVNCWFCNKNFWVKFLERNCWNCPSCEQYNGFTKDGDYNKTLINTNEQNVNKTPNVFQKSPPKNGLCKMCNINQQLKVMCLANFVPMNDRNFDKDVESYRTQLEKAYKLCTFCKKILQMKLHKEKILLGSKLLQSRTPEKMKQKCKPQSIILKSLINNTSMFISGVVLILVTVEGYKNVMKHENLFSTISNLKQLLTGLVESIFSIIKMKMCMTFPFLENYLNDINKLLDLDTLPKSFNFNYKGLDKINELTQKALGGFVCLIQIIGHLWNINELRYSIAIDLLWSVFVIATCFAHHPLGVAPTFVSLIKLLSSFTILLVYKKMKTKTVPNVGAIRKNTTPKRMRNLANGSTSSLTDDEDALDSDDDVSLSKFALHNFSDSSHEAVSPLNNSINNGRSFTPRSSDSIWAKPKLNSTFCVNSLFAESPGSGTDNLFVKPSFNKYQKLAKDNSDSELDESISTLCIGSPKKVKVKRKNNPVFALRKFRATPIFVAPTPVPMTRSRPLISPSKLGHSTSWIAEGYWGSPEGDQLFNLNGSRSSSQSSGFESQASSVNQRNLFSQPPSREESMCREPDKSAPLLDRFQNCNMNGYGSFQGQQNFVRMNSPVFPQMQYNSHVHIPQPRFAQQPATSPNVFAQQQFVQNGLFKTPGASGLIKLPQVNSLSSPR